MASLVWFRQDLRIADNPALRAACESGDPLIPVYIFSPQEEGAWAPGAASRVWLHQSLGALEKALQGLGSRLIVRSAADSLHELATLCRDSKVDRVFWNRRYEPLVIARDTRIKEMLEHEGIEVRSFNASLLFEPWEIRTKSAGPFQVFTPFWRACLAEADPAAPLAAPASLKSPERWPESTPLSALGLLPRIKWDQGIVKAWHPGSAGAEDTLSRFLHEAYEHYATGRDVPGRLGTSRLSPHLPFGEIGPRQVWHALKRFALKRGQHTSWRRSQFLTELGWREFAYHLLYHFPHTPEKPLREKFARFPWRDDQGAVRAWQRGATGFPIVDAGMRQLWHTGWIHNRVRMIVGSFLVKDLLASWNLGAAWFWDTLVDADLASNTLGWQWTAGCGADAAPYFRIFNPVTQATRFDPEGTYVREWVPELARLPGAWIQQPWAAPADVLREAGVHLGTSYPRPLIDHKLARERALAGLATLDKERST
jgi:deoxyribodipyrimidine photo-lyase